jgi:hypothetical protein
VLGLVGALGHDPQPCRFRHALHPRGASFQLALSLSCSPTRNGNSAIRVGGTRETRPTLRDPTHARSLPRRRTFAVVARPVAPPTAARPPRPMS